VLAVVHLFAMAGLGVLSMAWVQVEAAMPLGWRLMALVQRPCSCIHQMTRPMLPL